MAVSIAIASGKGGTGKTTISANLAVALAKLGKDVIVLDADIAMANLELVLGVEGKGKTLNDVLAGKASIEEAIYEGPAGVKVIPAGISLDAFRKARPEKLEEVLKKLHDMAEIIIIDCPAGIGKEALTAISAAENLILVVNPEISSIADALKVIAIAKKLGTNVLGAIINRTMKEDSELSAKAIATILEVPILGVVPEDPNVRKCAAFGEPIVLKYPDSPAAQAIMEIAAKLIGKKYIPEKKKEKESFIKKFIKGIFGGKK
ncbi:MAG TPA: septum site-determining protein MinD [Methanothermococcus okinawensis]|uniref:Septum site-determining protein MinD n=1 Tax=Methanothermococcus okinawensis TaxID=155863 RepID=A0A833E0V9_9EURY|nr:septum site-determining protein MinD [Methanothermococcus okinawensis]HIP91396.1 septum site-determining protein MinD [Methanothermococcus okinawensis]